MSDLHQVQAQTPGAAQVDFDVQGDEKTARTYRGLLLDSLPAATRLAADAA